MNLNVSCFFPQHQFFFWLLCCAAAVVALCRSPQRVFDSVGSLLFASFFVRHLLFLFRLTSVLSHNKRHLKRLGKNQLCAQLERVSERRRKRIVEWEVYTDMRCTTSPTHTQHIKVPLLLALAPFHLAHSSLFACLTLLSLLSACLLQAPKKYFYFMIKTGS